MLFSTELMAQIEYVRVLDIFNNTGTLLQVFDWKVWKYKKMLYICSKLFGMAMLVLQECISKLGAFKQAFGKQFGITKLGIFGSVARQENTEDSDIDIVVEVEKPTLSLMYELKEKLKELFNCEVDLVRFRPTLRPLFKSNILNDVVYV